MKPEYENLIRALRIEFTVEIREADANPDKWYELYIDEGSEIGTHTLHSANTFNEVVARFEQYARQYGISNTHIDIMRHPDDAEVDISLTHSAKFLNLPKLVNVHFRIESSYVWGSDHPGMSKEKEDAFFAERPLLFSGARRMGEKGWDFIRRAPPGKNHLAKKRAPGRHNPDLRSNRER